MSQSRSRKNAEQWATLIEQQDKRHGNYVYQNISN